MGNVVLIESDWNLKKSAKIMPVWIRDVLIESDWNLKDNKDAVFVSIPRINRIRLEFKGVCKLC